jgi:hypothetical protein
MPIFFSNNGRLLISLFLCLKKNKKIPPLGKKDIGSIMLLKCDEFMHVWKCGCGYFSNIFYLEMYQNDVFFLFLKNYF